MIEKISEVNEDKFLMLKVHLSELSTEGFKLISENDNNFNIYQSLFKRYVFSFESIGLLISDFDETKIYRTQSIAIILRASLLDYLTSLYIRVFQLKSHFDGESRLEYYNVIHRWQSEQLRRILDIPEKLKKSSVYDHSEFKKTVDVLSKSFSHLFDPLIALDYNKPSKCLKYQKKDDLTLTTIIKKLDEYAEDSITLDYNGAFNLYDVFSKYDHFGLMTMTLEKVSINEVSESIIRSLLHVTDGIDICIKFLKEENQSKSDFSRYLKEIDRLRSTLHVKYFSLGDEYKNKLRKL